MEQPFESAGKKMKAVSEVRNMGLYPVCQVIQYNGIFSLPVTSLPCQVALILLDSSEAALRQPEIQSLNPVNNVIIFF